MKTALNKLPKKKKPQITRIETFGVQGIPDVMLCDNDGNFHFVELKTTPDENIRLSPLQVSWLTRHSTGSVWLMVKLLARKDRTESIHLYHADRVMSAAERGTRATPTHCFSHPYDWAKILSCVLG